MSGIMIVGTGLFFYFAFGSNMLECRLKIRSTANLKILGIGTLENYSLDFSDQYSETWNSAFMTIVPREDSVVWGVIWEVPQKYLDKLDNQEGVNRREYETIIVNVTTSDGKIYECRTYQLIDNPSAEDAVPLNQLPDNRLPSLSYMNIVIKGAQENHLPDDYIEFLQNIKHNNDNTSFPTGVGDCLD